LKSKAFSCGRSRKTSNYLGWKLSFSNCFRRKHDKTFTLRV